MRRTKPRVRMLMAPMAMALLMGLAGCAVGYGDGYGDGGPGWDGQLYVNGGYNRDYHNQAFRAEGGRPAAVGSARGRASMGARGGGGGGGHAPSSGGGGRR